MILEEYTTKEQLKIDYCYTKFFWTAKSIKEYTLTVELELMCMKALGYNGYRQDINIWCEGLKSQLDYEKGCNIER